MFTFSYGQGIYQESEHSISGQIILGEHKLYLRDQNGDLASTYIPLEKINRLKLNKDELILYVSPMISHQYVVHLKGARKSIEELTRDLVGRRGLKKKFWIKEWFEEL
ncbi:MAG: hypothetical protein K8S27_08060 [Candidatus Omnitrophica bacterium]|nr:hypothetical protein [Candidatus Omnitrophota bacterium]